MLKLLHSLGIVYLYLFWKTLVKDMKFGAKCSFWKNINCCFKWGLGICCCLSSCSWNYFQGFKNMRRSSPKVSSKKKKKSSEKLTCLKWNNTMDCSNYCQVNDIPWSLKGRPVSQSEEEDFTSSSEEDDQRSPNSASTNFYLNCQQILCITSLTLQNITIMPN